jgi:peptidyl-prolyl cis-trans isomerase SurA
MKTRSILSLTLLLLLCWEVCLPQEADEKVLMTVGGRKVTAGEFIRMYNKGLDPDTRTDVDTYLQQFIEFKLKVADALSQGTDTTKAFKTELEGYRNQLARNYLTDPGLKEKLVQQAYQRSLTDIKASHILVNCPADAIPKDTLKAYKKAADIRERIISGESFEKLAKEESDDKSAEINGGDLGYFTVFQMIKPFEDAAYSLEPGSISQPVRTSFGYHLIFVTGRRQSLGKIRVAHIMKAVPKGADEKTLKEAESEIYKIYDKLRNGSSFSELAKQFSDHKESAAKNGELGWFGTGDIIKEFSEAAFGLSDTGEYTKPVRTIFGFHIIKLLDKKPPLSYNEAKLLIESKIKTSDINALSKQSLITKLKDEYNYQLNRDVFNWFVKRTDTLIMSGRSVYDQKRIPKRDIYSFADQHMTAKEFAWAIEKRSYKVNNSDPKSFIDSYIGYLLTDQIFGYENSILEKKYPEFRYLMKEFHDGILLFDVSSKTVWDRVRDDSTGLHRFYEEHKNNYLTKRGFKCKEYSLNIPGGLEKLTSAYNRFSGRPDADLRMLERFSNKGDSLLKIREQIYYSGNDRVTDSIDWRVGVHSFVKNNVPTIIFVQKILEPVPLPFNAVQAEMINGYQDQLMAEWIRQLRDKYRVEIDNSVYVEVKKILRNE